MIPNKKNNIISDWLDRHGDPTIDKQVIQEAELINKREKIIKLLETVRYTNTNDIEKVAYEICLLFNDVNQNKQ